MWSIQPIGVGWERWGCDNPQASATREMAIHIHGVKSLKLEMRPLIPLFIFLTVISGNVSYLFSQSFRCILKDRSCILSQSDRYSTHQCKRGSSIFYFVLLCRCERALYSLVLGSVLVDKRHQKNNQTVLYMHFLRIAKKTLKQQFTCDLLWAERTLKSPILSLTGNDL